jgi:ribosomal protein S18 acetylase RimI-like enzyme
MRRPITRHGVPAQSHVDATRTGTADGHTPAAPPSVPLMHIRPLTASDAVEFHALRLRALRDNPEAFGSTYAEEVDTPLDTVAARLESGAPERPSVVLGAAATPGGPLVGSAACVREALIKARHRAVIGGMYVAPEARGRGAGRALLEALVAHAVAWGGVEQITLTVVTDNVAARALYLARGFQPYGVAPRAFRDGGRYYDVEELWLPLPAPDGAR